MAQVGRFCRNTLYSRGLNNVSKQFYSSVTVSKPSKPVSSGLPAQQQFVGKAGSINVAYEDTPSDIATVGLFVRTGTGFETEANNGVGHVLRYLAANGPLSGSKQTISQALENAGGRLSVQTGREQTTFLAQVAKSEVETAVKVLGSIVQNLKTFSSAEGLKEAQGRVLNSLEDESDLTALSFEHLHSIAYQTSSLGLGQKGTQASVTAMTPQTVSDFVSSQFTSDRMVVAGSGSFGHDQLTNLVGKHITATESSQSALSAQPFIGSAVTVHDDSDDKVHISFAYEGAPKYTPSYYALKLAQELIGNYNATEGLADYSSTKIGEMLGNEHLATKLNTFLFGYSNTGVVGVEAYTDRLHVEDLIAEIATEYVRLSQGAIPNEVNRAKFRLINNLRRARDGTASIAQALGEQVLFAGRPVPLAEQFEYIERLDASKLADVCVRHFVDTEPVVVAIGNTLEVPDYNQIRGWTHWWRM